MKKLHPLAVWLFFVSFFLRAWFVLGVILYVLLIIIKSFTKTVAQDGEYVSGRWMGIDSYFWWYLLIVAYIVIAYVWARLSYYFYRYELTKNGFKKESGVIYKRYVTIPYDRIQNVDIIRGIWARILGLSDLQIQTAGMSGAAYYSEGRLPGLSTEDAEKLRDELVNRAHISKNQGL